MSERRHYPGVCIYTSPTTICENRPFADTPLCEHHLRKIIQMGAEGGGIAEALFGEPSRAIQDYLDQTDPARIERVEARRRELIEAAAPGSVVYYVRLGDHVKIGYTVNLRQRMGDLRADMADVLAVEPGGRELESQRHREWARHRLGRRENFVPVPALLEHIKATRAKYGDPLRRVPQRVIDKRAPIVSLSTSYPRESTAPRVTESRKRGS